nr:MCP four helix bundle domain-containing protein [Pseudomonas sp. FLM 11]
MSQRKADYWCSLQHFVAVSQGVDGSTVPKSHEAFPIWEAAAGAFWGAVARGASLDQIDASMRSRTTRVPSGRRYGIVSNNIVSIYNTANTGANALAYSRSLHAALLYKYANADSAKFEAAVQSMSESQKEVERLFKEYRQTPLANDERVAGDQFEKDWPAYLQVSNKVIALATAGSVLLSALDKMQQNLRTTVTEIGSAADQLASASEDAERCHGGKLTRPDAAE